MSSGLTVRGWCEIDWVPAQQKERQYATLPRWLLDMVVGHPARFALEDLLLPDAPRDSGQRLRWVLNDLKQRPARVTELRPHASTVSLSTVTNRACAARILLRTIQQTALDGVCPDSLAPWLAALPELKSPRVTPAHTDTSGPPLSHLRSVFDGRNRDIAQALSLRPGESELEALDRIAPKELRQRALWRRSGSRALLVLFVCVGPRVSAAARLTRDALVAEHLSPDGRRGPAIILPPCKHVREPRVKPIPTALYELLHFHVELTRRICAAEQRSVSDSGALFPGSLTNPDRHPYPSSLCRMLTGETRGGRRRTSPLVPREGRLRGCSPHALRHANATIIRRGAANWAPGGPDEAARAVLHLLVQDQKADKLPYLDLCSPREIERLSGAGIALAWSLLTTIAGTEATRDVASYRLTLALRDQLRRARRELIAAMPGAATGAEQLAVEDYDEALQRLEKRLAFLRDAPAARVVFDPQMWPEVVDDLEDMKDELRADLLMRGPLVRRFVTVTELCVLCEVSRPHLGNCWRLGRPIGTRDGLQPFGDGPVRLDPGIRQGERRRRILVEDLDPRFLADATRQAHMEIMLRRWPPGWSDEACRAPLAPRPMAPDELDLS